MADNSKDRSAVVVPFGKHKGATVAELLAKDPAYAEWVAGQGWVAERFAELHAAILSRGAASDDTPEHNAIQVRFLDPEFRMACLLAARPDEAAALTARAAREWTETRERCAARLPNAVGEADRARERVETIEASRMKMHASILESARERVADLEAEVTRKRAALRPELAHPAIRIKSQVKFEQRGLDVVMEFRAALAHDGIHPSGLIHVSVEIKPSLGDDFPSVMRQMGRLNCEVLVVGAYSGRAVSEPQLREMFAANGHILLFIRDIEAELANARGAIA